MRIRLFLGILVLFVWSCTPASDLSKYPAKTLAGETVKWNSHTEKVIILHFWATWCRDCIVELPSLIEAYNGLEETEKKKIGFIFLSDEEADRIQSFLETRTIPPFFMYRLEKSFKNYGIWHIPQTNIYKGGEIIQQIDRSVQWTTEDLRKLLGSS